MWIKLFLGLAGAATLIGLYWLGTNIFFLESASYHLHYQEGPFEIRVYPELFVATTLMESEGDDSAFRRLFQFIQGGNSRQQKIAMTTPVFIDRGETQERMSFVIPQQTRQEGIPDPTIRAVSIDKRAAARVAVYRFSGIASDKRNQEALRTLETWMENQRLKSDGEPFFAYYNAPFVPGPLRRNEVMLRLDD